MKKLTAVFLLLFSFTALVSLEENHRTWDLDVWKYTDDELVSLCQEMIVETQAAQKLKISSAPLHQFLSTVAHLYDSQNPYHNFHHAAEVFHFVYLLEIYGALEGKLLEIERLALLLAAIGHDVGHPGTNNAYQREFQTRFFQRFGSEATLEKYHAKLTIDAMKQAKLLSHLHEAEQVRIERLIFAYIIATDMEEHQKYFRLIQNSKDQSSFASLVLKSADLGHFLRPKKVSEKWVRLLFQELCFQKRIEEIKGVDFGVSQEEFRRKLDAGQGYFTNNIVKPLYEELDIRCPKHILPLKRLDHR